MICKQCNSTISDGTNYCPNCGYHYPSAKRGKTTFDVDFIRKAFFFKKKEKPTETNEKWEDVKPKRGKWGWGWYILFGLVFMGIKNIYTDYGDAQNFLIVIGTALSLIMYFYLRNKLLKEISTLYTRSFISGFISFVLTALIVGGIANFIKPNIKEQTSEYILNELKNSTEILTESVDEVKLIYEFFVSEPVTENEILNNIKIIDKSTPINNHKDSLMLGTYRKIHSHIQSVEKKHPILMEDYPIKSKLILSLIDKVEIFSQKYQIRILSLKDYYNALLINSNNQDILWNKYSIAEDEFLTAWREYLALSNHLEELCSNASK